ncbi:hypothetical protein PROFUN_07311 [Planoprotostelium fungivorum]|uniref:Uncharacterized protein n=1 Tax=Planoprotostelium fungivorum TaxID=1890364 RepID=A0A2P6MVP8_9EUKA|nr:hypothetical protein PROFUN_15589 [Planoprotostelium fungivorum]PRP85023.1 hypothetical protein PROFUN_07311 [Planoprotostelium fungivorum]
MGVGNAAHKIVEGKQKYLSTCCCALLILGIIYLIIVLGIQNSIFGALMIVLSICGFIGGCFPGGVYMLYFMIGTSVLLVYNVILLIYNIFGESGGFKWIGVVLNVINVVFFLICLVLAFLNRKEKMQKAENRYTASV